MVQMYVANATQQVHILAYRVTENPNAIEQQIQPGGQVQIRAKRGNLSTEDVKSIVGQFEPYGLIGVDEVARRSGKNGLIYSLGKPVPMPRILAQIEHNRQVMIRVGKDARQAAAVASNDRINNQLSEMVGHDVMQQLSVEIEQRTSAHVVNEGYGNAELARQLAESDTIAEGIRIDQNAPAPSRGARPRAARSRASRT